MRTDYSKRIIAALLIVTALSMVNVFAIAKPDSVLEAPVTADEEWTIIVYLAADNNLQLAGVGDLEEMEAVGAIDGVNVVVLMDTIDIMEGTHWYSVGDGETHFDAAGVPSICDCEEVAGVSPGELNMGDPASLTYCLETAIAFAPADHYMLVLWDHGGGWWGVCYDESSTTPTGSTDRLTMDEVQQAVNAASVDGVPVDLDVIGYDACFMGMVEIAYENRGLAELMVASITTVPGDGWDYTAWLSGILTTDRSPYAVSEMAATTYVDFYSICAGVGLGGFPYCSMGVFDLTKVGELVTEGIDPVAEALIPLTEQYFLRGPIESSESQTPQIQFHGEAFPFTDIGWFMTLLGEKIPELSDETAKAVDLLEETIVYFDYVKPDADMCLRSYGMSIYYTISGDKLYDNYLTSALDMVNDTNWDEFLWALAMTA